VRKRQDDGLTWMTDSAKTIYIIAGPNGAGKTTFARQYLPVEAQCLAFINADLIAAGLEPFEPERAAVRAGRLMLELIDQHVERDESFAFETTLAAMTIAKSIPMWRVRGYAVILHFLALPTVERALDRVARRVRQGGHAVGDDVVRRRFIAGLRNFEQIYKALVDQWVLLDNSGPEPKIVHTNPKHQNRFDGVLAALRRAKRDAEDLAIATGTELVEGDEAGNAVLLTSADIIARREKAATGK
jgi:predicted ABC-type ATPase